MPKWRRQAHLLVIDSVDGTRITVELDTGRTCLWNSEYYLVKKTIITVADQDSKTVEIAQASLDSV